MRRIDLESKGPASELDLYGLYCKYQTDAHHGDRDAQAILASFAEEMAPRRRGFVRTKSKLSDRFAELNELAYQGNSAASKALAIFFEHSEPPFKNDVKAILHYEVAAMSGDVYANCKCGLYQLKLEEKSRNYDKALKFLYVAGERGNKCAQYNLARMHAAGMGTPINIGEARLWYELIITSDPNVQNGYSELALREKMALPAPSGPSNFSPNVREATVGCFYQLVSQDLIKHLEQTEIKWSRDELRSREQIIQILQKQTNAIKNGGNITPDYLSFLGELVSEMEKIATDPALIVQDAGSLFRSPSQLITICEKALDKVPPEILEAIKEATADNVQEIHIHGPAGPAAPPGSSP